MTQSMLTTTDNPFDPFTQYDEWLSFDEDKGYYSCSLLAWVTKTSESLSPQDEAEAIELAIDEIVTENVSGMHARVSIED
jgi:hypothetical protein